MTIPYQETYLWDEMKPRRGKFMELIFAQIKRDNKWYLGAMSDEVSFRKLNRFTDGHHELDFYVSEGTPIAWRYATDEERKAHGWNH